ncbi:MAG: translation elongation factor Ts [Planctomycetes bacterium]|nr:translation elongation factor Ts [Planctomycetota bacterium]MDA8379158.1 translation elongation factor Ts [Planctomycetia bacterium]
MVEISAKDVMTLRARTNAGMMDAKKALQEAHGDMEAAGELLRKWGAGRAESKTSNVMKEGLVGGKISADGKLGVLVRLGCQTDFVARNEGFQKLLQDLVDLAFTHEVSTPAQLNAVPYSDGSGRTVEAVIKELVGGTIKENMAVTGLARYKAENGLVGKYVHHNAKVGALVQVDGSSEDAVRVLLGEIAMHVTAGMPFVPLAISREAVDPAVVQRERELAAESIKNKPAAIIEKIVSGKLDKFFADNVLLEQPFVKDENLRIRDLLAQSGKAVAATLRLVAFARFKVGEV